MGKPKVLSLQASSRFTPFSRRSVDDKYTPDVWKQNTGAVFSAWMCVSWNIKARFGKSPEITQATGSIMENKGDNSPQNTKSPRPPSLC